MKRAQAAEASVRSAREAGRLPGRRMRALRARTSRNLKDDAAAILTTQPHTRLRIARPQA